MHIDYPGPGQSLFANVRAVTGWVHAPQIAPESLTLQIDQRHAGTARLGYPRLDATDSGVDPATALRSGFRCEFDPSRLKVGPHRFEFIVRGPGGEFQVDVPVDYLGDEAPLQVSDIFVDVVGHCNLRCTMCPQGNVEGLKGNRRFGVMPPHLLATLLQRLAREGLLGEFVNLYNWGDPILHPQLDELLDIVAAHGRKAIISTNLSVAPTHVDRLLRSSTDLLIISISGMTQEVYQRNHRGGRIDRVLGNARTLAGAAGQVRQVLLKYLVFDYNRHEIEPAMEFAAAHGLHFGAYRGAVPSAESYLLAQAGTSYFSATRPFVGSACAPTSPMRTCPQESTLVIDHAANLEICCVAWQNRYGQSALTADLRQYLLTKLQNATCTACLGSGYAHQKHYDVIDPTLLPFMRPRIT